MIALFRDNFLSKEECDNLIKVYKKNINKKDKKINAIQKVKNVFPLAVDLNNDLDENVINKFNQMSALINDSVADWGQIVRWTKNSFQDLHFDNASSKTTLSSICYLNENFEGGQTYFKEGTLFMPKTGRALFFDGNYYFHGVKEILSKERYVLALWYKNKSYGI
jgi:hypothetical protein